MGAPVVHLRRHGAQAAVALGLWSGRDRFDVQADGRALACMAW